AGSAPDQALHLPAVDLPGSRSRAHLRGRVPLPGPQGADPHGRPRLRDAELQRVRGGPHLPPGRGLTSEPTAPRPPVRDDELWEVLPFDGGSVTLATNPPCAVSSRS